METVGAERDGITRKMAEAELRERLVRVERKGVPPTTGADVRRVGRHLAGRSETRRRWKPSTVKVSTNAVKHLKEEFGPTRLASLRPRDVAAYGKTALETFSAKTVQLHLNILHDIYKTALAEELVQAEPGDGSGTSARHAQAVAHPRARRGRTRRRRRSPTTGRGGCS